MARRLPLIVLLASALTFFASLFLTWSHGVAPAGILSRGPDDLLNLFSGGIGAYDGWQTYGEVAALVALALAAVAGASLAHPELGRRLPLASAGLALLYLALLNAAEVYGYSVFAGSFDHHRVVLGRGAFLGIASAAIVLLEAIVLRWDEVARRPSLSEVVAWALTAGLLVSYVLPWLQIHSPQANSGATGYVISATPTPIVTFIALLACFALPLWRSTKPPAGRQAATLGLAVLVWGGLSYRGVGHWPYEAWLQLGCSVALVVLVIATSRGLQISSLPVADLAAGMAAGLLVLSLFLPWQKVCGPDGGYCGAFKGWALPQSTIAGGLAVILLVSLVGYGRLFLELAVGVAIYLMAEGFTLTRGPEPGAHLSYGAPLGFAGAALLLVAAARRLGGVPPDPKRLLTRFLPMLACVIFIAIPLAPLWDTVSLGPITLAAYEPWRGDWLELGAILVALRLLVRWLGGPKADDELVLLPLALFVVTVLDVALLRRAGYFVDWESWLSIGLCVLLGAFGWWERSGGLAGFRIPEEIWRVDRLPGES